MATTWSEGELFNALEREATDIANAINSARGDLGELTVLAERAHDLGALLDAAYDEAANADDDGRCPEWEIPDEEDNA